MRQSGVTVSTGEFQNPEKHFPDRISDEEVANGSNPCVIPVQLSSATGLYCSILSNLKEEL